MSSMFNEDGPGIIDRIRSLFPRRDAGSSIAIYDTTSASMISSATSDVRIYTANRPLNPNEVEQIRENLMRELREDGKLIDEKNSTLRPMDEERRKRKIDSILEDTKEE